MNQRLGLTTHASWHQANPDGTDLAVVVIDGPGAETFLGKMATSDNEFDTVVPVRDRGRPPDGLLGAAPAHARPPVVGRARASALRSRTITSGSTRSSFGCLLP